YRAALQSHATTADDAKAVASLPAGPKNPVNANPSVQVQEPLAVVLGLVNQPVAAASIQLNTSICNLDRTSTDAKKFDLQAVVMHEINEVLGFGSLLDGVSNGTATSTGAVFADDLFRYSAPNARSFTTSATAQAFFSFDGGQTNIAQFNQKAGDDFGDWI